ncbi:MAG TPA: SUMF1/EgtB/PvdO family nonheme iron enzyme, partial [Planctomycetota bacterium]|nr:SUMF1/EgtB/PvdO family nonheme iron enzyme [Planctomycetota bacterium]
KEPDKRYPTAAALAQDLESFLATGKVAAKAPVRGSGVRTVSRSSARVPVPAVEPAATKKKPPVALIAGGGVVVLVALVFLLARGTGGGPPPTLDLRITSPAETSEKMPLLLASAELSLAGKLSDPSAGPVRVLEEGREPLDLAVSTEGAFGTRLALAPGTKTLDVIAGSGPREVRKRIQVEIDSEPPSVTLERHESVRPGETVEAIALVRGRHPGATVRFVVKQGQEEPDRRDVPRDGRQARFSFEVRPGVDRVRVTAEVTDQLGRKASDEGVIDVKAPAPEVVVTAPPPPPPPMPPPAAETPEALELKLTLDPIASPTNATSVLVHGHVEPPTDGTVALKLDDDEARTFDVPHGEVKAQLPLATEGLHIVRVRVHAAGAIELTGELRVTVDRKPPDVKLENLTKPEAGDTTVAVTITPSKPVRSLKANGKELVTGTPSAGPFELDLDVPATGDPKLEVVAVDVAGNERKLAPKTFPRPPRGTPETAWEKGLKLPDHVRRGKERPVYVYAPPVGKKKLEIELVYVPPPADKKDASGFFVGRTPITWKQYRAYCALAGVTEPPPPKHGGGKEGDFYTPAGEYKATDDRPVTMVGFDDCKGFCDWASLRLPTEAEWNRISGHDDGRRYPWGSDPPRTDLCWAREDCKDAIAPPAVGSHPKGASPYGALDLLGCVWEWNADVNKDGGRVIKGMSFIYPRAELDLGWGGAWGGPDWRVGFRVVLDAPKAKTGK